jgi:hypothetical protein
MQIAELVGEGVALGGVRAVGLCRGGKTGDLRQFGATRAGKIVVGLHIPPKARIGFQGGGEPQRHFGGDPGAAVENLRECNARYADMSSHVGYVHVAQHATGMRRIVHLCRHYLSITYSVKMFSFFVSKYFLFHPEDYAIFPIIRFTPCC